MGLGNRYNKDKLEWHNFPLFLVRPMIEVAHFGATKYDSFNFLKGLKVSNCQNSMMRHLDKFFDPTQPDYDEESGKHHLAHVAWNALVCLYMATQREGLDDRYKGVNDENDS